MSNCFYCNNTFTVVTMIKQFIPWILSIILLIAIVICIIKKKYNVAIALAFLEILIVLYNNLFILQ
jgi:hypothetical protein